MAESTEMAASDLVEAHNPASPVVMGHYFRAGNGRWILTLPFSQAARRDPQRMAFHFLVDNSASMGDAMRVARDELAPLIEYASEPCSFIVFSHQGECLSRELRIPSECVALQLPRQSQTNISHGVMTALNVICASDVAEPGAIHHVMFLLSDGQHNNGERPSEYFPKAGRWIRESYPNLKLSVVIIGISAASRTSDGMLGRAELETVQLHELEPIYYADTVQDMVPTLLLVKEGIQRLLGGHLVRVDLPDDSIRVGLGFIRVPGHLPTASFEAFVAEHEEIVVLASSQRSAGEEHEETVPTSVRLDGADVHLAEVPFNDGVATEELERLISVIRQWQVARHIGKFNGPAALSALEPLVKALEDYQKNITGIDVQQHYDGRHRGHGPTRRLQNFCNTMSQEKNLRNQLLAAVAFHSRDSAEQARFLTGARYKYAGKALRRATKMGTDINDFNTLLESVASTAQRLRLPLRRDLIRLIARLSSEERETIAARPNLVSLAGVQQIIRHPEVSMAETCDKSTAAFLDNGEGLETLLSTARDLAPSASYMSLKTQWEQLLEWVDDAEDAARMRTVGVHAEYELLAYVGMLGYPIHVARNAACQMDPFQMHIKSVKTAPADTASVCVGLRSEHTMTAPDGGELRDLLLLVDPDCPESSRLALKCKLVNIYHSIVICRDLRMFSGLQSHIALHSHALWSIVTSEKPTGAEWDIALRTCYSIRKLWADNQDSCKEYRAMIKRLRGNQPLTFSHNVLHVSQVVIALAANADEEDMSNVPDPQSTMLLINEYLSRSARRWCRDKAGGDKSKVAEVAAKRVQCFLGISDDSVPTTPEDLQELRPPLEVLAACRGDVEPDRTTFDFQDWVHHGAMKILRALSFTSALSTAMRNRGGGWARLEKDMEAGRPTYADVSTCVAQGIAGSLPTLDKACDFDAESLGRVCATIAAQAHLARDGADREHLPDVREADTLQQIAMRLRAALYEKQVKEMKARMPRKRNLAQVSGGDPDTFAHAKSAQWPEYFEMLGHNLSRLKKSRFWALWAAAQGNEAKMHSFLTMADQDFKAAYGPCRCYFCVSSVSE